MKKKTLLVSSLILVLMVSTFVLPATVSATPGAEITTISGTVEVQKKGTTEWVKVKNTPYPLNEGDKVRTGASSTAEIKTDSKKLKLKENAEAELTKDSKGNWSWTLYKGACIVYCTAVLIVSLIAGPAGLVTASVICGILAIYTYLMDELTNIGTACAFRNNVTVQTFDGYGYPIAQTSITGSLGLYPNGAAWANGQQVPIVLYDGTISEPIEVSLSPSEAMELYKFVYGEGGVGGIVISVDKFGLLAPYIGLASTILAATVATAVYVKRVKRKKEKQ